MTMYHGMLLIDSPEPAIGKWENQLGFRGLKEVWAIPGTEQRVEIDCDDDYEGDPEHDPEGEAGWEVRVEDDKFHGGCIEYIAFGSFAQCDDAAKEFMATIPEGGNVIEAARRFSQNRSEP